MEKLAVSVALEINRVTRDASFTHVIMTDQIAAMVYDDRGAKITLSLNTGKEFTYTFASKDEADAFYEEVTEALKANGHHFVNTTI